MIFDIFLYNGEREVLDIRFGVLAPHVDIFIPVYMEQTISGRLRPKPEYDEHLHTLRTLSEKHKVRLACAVPQPCFPSMLTQEWTWLRETHMRNCGVAYAANFIESDSDIVFLSDLDEIWNPAILPQVKTTVPNIPVRLVQVYNYYKLNNTSGQTHSAIACEWRYLQTHCAQSCRDKAQQWSDAFTTISDAGWHFSCLGSPAELRRKIGDFAHQEINIPSITGPQLDSAMENGEDFLHRPNMDFHRTDPSTLPDYVRQRLPLFSDLIRHN